MIGIVAVIAVDRDLPRPVRVHLPHRVQDHAGGVRPRTSPCRRTVAAAVDNFLTVLTDARLHHPARLHQQHHADRVQRGDHGRPRGDGRATCCSAQVPLEPADQLPGAGRADRAAGRRADHLGAAGPRPVQEDARHDPDQGAFGLSFCILLFRAFVSTIPRELDEAAIIDGAGPMRLFFPVILPLLKPVMVTVVVVQAVVVFNDFTDPLYFLPGNENATVQLTLYNFQSQMLSQWNLLFMDILLITIPPLIMYIFFNRQIVAGMTSGAVKG